MDKDRVMKTAVTDHKSSQPGGRIGMSKRIERCRRTKLEGTK